MRISYRSFLLTCSFLLTLLPMPAHATKSLVCAAILRNVKPYHSIPGTSKMNTSIAYNKVRVFRANDLGEPLAKPSLKAVTTSSIGTETDKQHVARRIRGIEEMLRQQGDDDGEMRSITMGTMIKGKEAILDFYHNVDWIFHRLNILSKNYKNSGGHISQFELQIARTLPALAALSATSFSIANVMLAITALNQGIPSDLVLGLTTLFPTALMSEVTIRAQQAGAHGLVDEVDIVQQKLNDSNLNPSQNWNYFSSNVTMSRTLLNTMLSTKADEVLQKDIEGQLSNDWMPRTTLSIFKPIGALLGKLRGSKEIDEYHVYSDRLLTFDADGTPVLTVFVRTTVEKPNFPKAPKRAKDRAR